jgi:glycosyltransferase involved in cell wall biosynthesis
MTRTSDRRGKRSLRTLTLVSAGFGHPDLPDLRGMQERGEYPRVTLFADALNSTILDDRATRATGSGLVTRLPVPAAQIAMAFQRRGEYDAVVAWAENLGLPLAFLLKLSGSTTPLIGIWSWISRPKKALALRLVQSHVARIVLMSSRQRDFAVEELGIPPHKVPLLRWPVDQQFWKPYDRTTDMICSVGREMRDYATLIAALRELPVPCHIAANTRPGIRDRWVRDVEAASPLPSHITVGKKPYPELRDLYARSRFVIMPLYPTTTDNGTTAILEAMAMGKAVICSRVEGQKDVVLDGVNGLLVPPRDPRALRAAIEHLWSRPELAAAMGAAGRRTVENQHTLDEFVGRVREIVEKAVEESHHSRGRRAPEGTQPIGRSA